MKQKPGLPTPVTSSPVFRRRRTIWCLLICITCFFVFFLTSSTSLYPSGLFGSSPAEPNSLGRDILELHGLQHFVLNSDLNLHNVLYKANRDRPQGIPVRDHIRDDSDDSSEGAPDTERDRLDPTKEIDLKVYSSFDGDDDWVKHVKKLQTNSPLVVFSKEREADGHWSYYAYHYPKFVWGHPKSYCPFSKRAKNLLQTYGLDPPPKIIEVDLREDGDLLKVILTRLTKHSTFPNIVLRGRSLGGADDLHALHDGGKLRELFEDNGLSVQGSR